VALAELESEAESESLILLREHTDSHVHQGRSLSQAITEDGTLSGSESTRLSLGTTATCGHGVVSESSIPGDLDEAGPWQSYRDRGIVPIWSVPHNTPASSVSVASESSSNPLVVAQRTEQVRDAGCMTCIHNLTNLDIVQDGPSVGSP